MATARLQKGILDLETGEIVGTRVRLSPTERALAQWLLAAGEPADVERLLREVWGYREGVRSRTVYVTIDRLRKKLEVDPKNPVHLVTEEGGYRLVPSPPRAVPDGFVGRGVVLDELDSLLARGGAIGIHGPGGVGKTHLAEVACAVLAGRFGEHLALELRGVEVVEEALQHVSRALGLDAAEPERIRAALGAREPVLVYLDDLDALEGRAGALVEALAPGPSRAVLVTSRQVVEGAVPLRLQPLEPWASRALLASLSRVPVAEDELDRLAAHLDHLPLPLALVAPWLGRVGLAELLQQRAGFDALESCIGRSWDRLEPSLQAWLAELARWGGRLPLSLAMRLAPGAALDLLEELERESLITVVDGQVRILETVRVFAAERATEAADPRVHAWAHERCATCRAALSGPGHATAVAELGRERTVVLRILEAGARDDAWAAAVLDLARVLDRSGPAPQLDRWLAEVEAGERPAALALRCRATRAHWSRTRGEAALSRLGASPPAGTDPEVAASWWVQCGLARHQAGDAEGALAAFQEVLDADLGNHLEVRRAWFGVARVRRSRQEHDAAAAALRTLEGLTRVAEDPLHGMIALATRGMLERSRGELLAAEGFLRSARKLAEALGDAVNGAHVDKALGSLAGLQGRTGESSRLLRAALATYQRHGLLESEGFVRIAQAADALWAGQSRACEEALLAAEDAFARTGFELAQVAISGLRGRLLASRGELEPAISAFEAAVTHGRASPALADTLWAFSEICRRAAGQAPRDAAGRELVDELRSLLADASVTERREAVLARLADPALDRAGLGL